MARARPHLSAAGADGPAFAAAFARVLAAAIAALALALALARPAAAAGLDAVVTDASGGRDGVPIVLVLHGSGSNGRRIRRLSAFDTWARAAGVVAVYPTAPGGLWNDGRWAALDRPDIAARDDVAALLALVDRVGRGGPGDPARLYVIGQANGAAMALRLACAAPSRLAGIAVIGSKILTSAPCEDPDTPVPALFFYGTADELAPPAGRTDPAAALTRARGRSFSAADTIAIWRARNRCGAESITARDPVPDDGVSLRQHDFVPCAAPLRYIEMVGAGHSWPGARPAGPIRPRAAPERRVRDLDAGDTALRFWLGAD